MASMVSIYGAFAMDTRDVPVPNSTNSHVYADDSYFM